MFCEVLNGLNKNIRLIYFNFYTNYDKFHTYHSTIIILILKKTKSSKFEKLTRGNVENKPRLPGKRGKGYGKCNT
jgi:hypothetical protein